MFSTYSFTLPFVHEFADLSVDSLYKPFLLTTPFFINQLELPNTRFNTGIDNPLVVYI